MNQEFLQKLQQEYIAALVSEFVIRGNQGKLDYNNYCDEALEVIIYIENILRAFSQGYGPLA